MPYHVFLTWARLASREHISSLQERLRYLEGVIAGQAHINLPPNEDYHPDPDEGGHTFEDDDNGTGDLISPTSRHPEKYAHNLQSH